MTTRRQFFTTILGLPMAAVAGPASAGAPIITGGPYETAAAKALLEKAWKEGDWGEPRAFLWRRVKVRLDRARRARPILRKMAQDEGIAIEGFYDWIAPPNPHFGEPALHTCTVFGRNAEGTLRHLAITMHAPERTLTPP